MARRKSYNPERRAWRGRSYRRGGKRVRDLRTASSAMSGLVRGDEAAQVREYAARSGVAVEVQAEDDDVVLVIEGERERFLGWDVEAMCARIDAVREETA